MKGRFVATAFLTTIFLTACSKESMQQKDSTLFTASIIQPQDTKPQVFSSDWESVTAWTTQKDDNGITFLYSRDMPQLSQSVLDNGVVIVFARNLWADEPEFKDMGAADKPLKMPFYYLPYFEKPDYTEQWNYTTAANKINVALNITGASAVSVPNNKVQLRYIVIPKEVLAQKGQAVEAVRKMSYNDLVQTFKLN